MILGHKDAAVLVTNLITSKIKHYLLTMNNDTVSTVGAASSPSDVSTGSVEEQASSNETFQRATTSGTATASASRGSDQSSEEEYVENSQDSVVTSCRKRLGFYQHKHSKRAATWDRLSMVCEQQAKHALALSATKTKVDLGADKKRASVAANNSSKSKSTMSRGDTGSQGLGDVATDPADANSVAKGHTEADGRLNADLKASSVPDMQSALLLIQQLVLVNQKQHDAQNHMNEDIQNILCAVKDGAQTSKELLETLEKMLELLEKNSDKLAGPSMKSDRMQNDHWADMGEDWLKKKTCKELAGWLEARGTGPTKRANGRYILKADLISKIKTFQK